MPFRHLKWKSQLGSWIYVTGVQGNRWEWIYNILIHQPKTILKDVRLDGIT